MDVILTFINNPLVLTALTVLFGLWVRYHPSAAKIPDSMITYMNAIISFLVKIGAPASAHADTLFLGTAPLASLGAGLWGIVGSSIWQSLTSYLVFKGFLHDPMNKALGVDQPPQLQPVAKK